MDSPTHTVLVVDDDASIRFLCRVNLEMDGWTVRDAGSIEEARAELASGDVNAMLLDVHIGTKSGIEFLKEVRREFPLLPVAMLTGSVGSPTLDGVRTDAVISKPFTLQQLTGTVRRLVPREELQPG